MTLKAVYGQKGWSEFLATSENLHIGTWLILIFDDEVAPAG